MTKQPIIIVGNGGHARMVQDFIEEMDEYEIVGVTSVDADATSFFGYPVLGTDDVLPSYFEKGITHVAMGVGAFRETYLRQNIFLRLKEIGFRVATIIHPSAVVSRYAHIGEGTLIMPNAVINNDVKLGRNCMVANGVIVSHETVTEDNVFFSAGVTIGGSCHIGEGTLFALGSNLISGVNVGRNVLVAAGATVVSNQPDNVKLFGTPAKIKK